VLQKHNKKKAQNHANHSTPNQQNKIKSKQKAQQKTQNLTFFPSRNLTVPSIIELISTIFVFVY